MYRKKNIIMLIMCISVLLMVIAYAAFSTVLQIGVTGNITSTWNIYFESITTKTTQGYARNVVAPSKNGTSASFNYELRAPGDSISYEIVLKNGGTLDAVVSDITVEQQGSSMITYTIEGIEKGDKITKGQGQTITILIEFDKSVTNLPSLGESGLTITINCLQYSGESSGGGSSSTTVVFNKENPSELTFTSTKDISTFQEVRVDNKVVDSSNYTVTSGSTIITFKKEYLQTLGSGTHTIEIVSTSGVETSTLEVNTTRPSTSLVENILSNNEVYADNVPSKYVTNSTGINFGAISSDTNGKGLYYTSTNTENNRTTYYFRGAVENNYVKFGVRQSEICEYNNQAVLYIVNPQTLEYSQTPTESQCLSTPICDAGTILSYNYGLDYRFVTGLDAATCTYLGGTPLDENEIAHYGNYADILWRIVRINEDGSIRLVTDHVVGNSYFLNNRNYDPENAHVGYMFGSTGQTGTNAYKLTHANNNSNAIKTYIDDWYTNNTNLSSLRATHLADAGFCNDRSIAASAGVWHSTDTALGYGDNETYYRAYNRLVNNKNPQFACPNASNDLFTTSTSTKGNKALSNPIGLITADEMSYAGGVFGLYNTTYYLLNEYQEDFWTMTPSNYSYQPFVFGMSSDGYVGYYMGTIGGGSGVRPVINLQSGVEIIQGGTGTSWNPYVIKIN